MSEFSDAVPGGRVVGLWRYPVKSMGAEVLSEAQAFWRSVSHGNPLRTLLSRMNAQRLATGSTSKGFAVCESTRATDVASSSPLIPLRRSAAHRFCEPWPTNVRVALVCMERP